MIVNWNLMRQPMNWVTIFLMLIIAAMFGHLALSYFGVEPQTEDSSS